MLDKLKIAAVLVVIGMMSGFLIWGTNEITAEGIATNKILKEQGYYKEILGLDEDFVLAEELSIILLDGDLVEEVIITDPAGNIYGYIYKGSERNNYGDITVLVGINLDGEISSVVISGTSNTPTFVKKITDDYLSPFAGQDIDNIEYDSRTGATFTYGSVSKFVEAAATYYSENRGVE
jgi:electron transport complex protein RnfG